MGTRHTYRVIVRGVWDGLTDEARQRLLAEVDAHGLDALRFTEEGSLAYDAALRRFSYRFVVVCDAEEGEEMAAMIAEERAEAALRALGYGHRDLTSSTTDMDTMKINDRGRRAAGAASRR
ncbi:DUF6204 family protein [Streptomyces coeruleoprunus]|uniref:DUF6204 family protein n=1 Tax=Streptomyces coeruleoprunus TaxID=285563 RepID=A0ABV9X8Z1_9ACTN